MGHALDREDTYEVTYKLTTDHVRARGHMITGRTTKRDAEDLAERMNRWSYIEWARPVPSSRAHRRRRRPGSDITVKSLAAELGITEWGLYGVLARLATCAGLMFSSRCGLYVAPWAAAGARAEIPIEGGR